MLVELLRTILIWGGIAIVSLAVLTVVGALCMGGFNESHLTHPKSRKPDSNAP